MCNMKSKVFLVINAFIYLASGPTDHFTVVCSGNWPLNGTEAGGDLALIQTSLLLSCK